MIVVTAVVIIVIAGLLYLLDHLRRALDAGEELRADLIRQLDDARDERDLALDEIDRCATSIDKLRERADTAEIALAYTTLLHDGNDRLTAATLALSGRG